MIKRDAEKKIRLFAKQFRALAIVGPRQSGKTTLVKKVFPKKPYVSLEDPDEREMALEDPRFFLSRFKMALSLMKPKEYHNFFLICKV